MIHHVLICTLLGLFGEKMKKKQDEAACLRRHWFLSAQLSFILNGAESQTIISGPLPQTSLDLADLTDLTDIADITDLADLTVLTDLTDLADLIVVKDIPFLPPTHL